MAAAARWYLRAAQAGDALAALHLGRMYWNGNGVKADRVSAYMFVLLASQVLVEAKQDLARFHAAMGEKEVRKAETKAGEFLRNLRVTGLRKSAGLDVPASAPESRDTK